MLVDHHADCRVTLARPRARTDVSLGEADKLVHEFIPKGGKLPVYARWIEGART